jgi:hypothetical protein
MANLVFFVSSIANESNSNSLANQLGSHLILAKQKKLASNILINQLGNTRIYARVEDEKK